MQNRPKLDIAITREDNKMKFAISKYELKLTPVKEGTQRYDFLALEQWITKVAKLEYTRLIERDRLQKDLQSLLDIPSEPQEPVGVV